MADFSFSKNERLCGERAIGRLFQEGKSGFIYPYRYYWLSEPLSDEFSGEGKEINDVGVKVLFSVPKKQFKRAVKRNLLKRRGREAYRVNKKGIICSAKSKGYRISIAFVYSSKEKTDFKGIEDGIKRILEKIEKSI